jgi:hypothetical protein
VGRRCSDAQAIRQVLFRLWLAGSSLWALFWIAMLTVSGDVQRIELVAVFAIAPPLAVGVLGLILRWAFLPVLRSRSR